MNSSHPKPSVKPHSMGPSGASSSVPPHLKFNHQTPHPTSKSLNQIPQLQHLPSRHTMPLLNNDTVTSPPPARKRLLPNRELTTTGNKYVAKYAKGFLAHNPLYRPPKHKSTTAMKCSPKKPTIQTKLKTPNYLRYTYLHRFSYMV